jgi:hypothetical protein
MAKQKSNTNQQRGQQSRPLGKYNPGGQAGESVQGAAPCQEGIRANAVAPGPIWTPLNPSTLPEDSVVNFGKAGADAAAGTAG